MPIFCHLIRDFHSERSKNRRTAVIIGLIHFLPKKNYIMLMRWLLALMHFLCISRAQRHFLCISLITSDEKTN